MSSLTRRGFLNGAAQAGVISQIGLEGALAAPGAVQRQSNFDTDWKFSRGDFPGAEMPGFADGGWSAIDLPHDWSIAGPYDETAPGGGSFGYLPSGIGWYRKQFMLPDALSGKRMQIQFDGVYQRSEVWINGQHLGMRPYGFITFLYDLTPYLKPGANVIAVRVDNSLQPNSRWYSGSGIYRHVWLIATDPVHVANWGVCVRTSEVTAAGAIVEVTTRVRNETAHPAACTLKAAIRDPDGRSIAMGDVHAAIPANGEHEFTQKFRLENPALWSLVTPQLYALDTALQAGASQDAVTTGFGIRDARFDVDQGFVLNGERIKLNGVCLHGDCGAVGTAVPERMWERRLTLLKEMGCNSIRTSHNPPAVEFLDMCDRMGFLVMDEAFDEWRQGKAQTPQYGYHKYFDEWSARDLSDMLDRDRNHPSIVIWSAGNEVPDQTAPDGPQTLQRLLDIIRDKDRARPVTVACDNIAAEPKPTPQAFLEKLDVVGYNYVDRWRDRREKFYSIDRHDYPQRRFIGTESTALGGVRGAYILGEEPPIFGERTGNRRVEAEQLEKFIQTYDYVSGDFKWTGIDYLGESRWPSKLASSGALDTCGFPKDSFYFYQSQWTRKPVLHLSPHWNWSGHEGQTISVLCYTNCETVELFLNGKSLGVKGYAFPRPGMIDKWPDYPPRAKALQTTGDLHLAWDVPYAPGVLKAVGTINGAPAQTQEIRTVGEPDGIRLSVDRDHIDTGPHDVAHVTVEILDKDGSLVPMAENDIAFALDGAGKIIGVDNGRPDSHEPYQASQRKAFGGLALVLLQSDGRAGVMTLTATSPALKSATIRISAA